MAKKKTNKTIADVVKDMSTTDLQTRINDDKLRLKKMQFAHAISPLENPMTLRGLRRDVAKLQTELTKRKLA